MAKFNEKIQTTPNAVSYEGGVSYAKNAVEEWLNFLFSSYLEDRFYEKTSRQMERFLDLTSQMVVEYGPEFVAKASMFARKELGMRSVSQVVAALLSTLNFDNKRAFFHRYCTRPDDISEIFSILDCFGAKRSHALVRGCGDYLSKLSPYTLGKYKLAHKKYNMYDLINITHAHSGAIDAYKNGTLVAPDTWEVAISTAEDSVARSQEWKRLVEEHKLGYLALLRNLRNILAADGVDRKWIEDWLYPSLVNKNAIKTSMVFPYQIYSAYKNMDSNNLTVIGGLEQAFVFAVDNMPKLAGDTLVILDVSGSMTDCISKNSDITIREAGAVYAMCIMIASEHSDIVKFASRAKKFDYNLNDNLFHIIEKLDRTDGLGYGTELQYAYGCVDRKYDRIMLISDMQIMVDDGYWYNQGNTTSYQKYCKQYGRTPIYSFDLGNYHTQTDNPNNPDVYLCTSLSEETLRFISLLENGESIVDYINNNYDFV